MISFDLNSIWFLLVGVLLTGYAILDGFDLGVGALHLFIKGDHERRIFINSIGPVWDGNEVWLVTGGGALFAAFPEVYATAFSGFYVAFMLLLCGLIFRAVAIEFRSKRESPRWRHAWDISFSVSSIVSALLIGVALGNVIWGVRLGDNHEYAGSFFDLLNPYALLVGVTVLALFVMHGAIYLVLKTEGELQETVKPWVRKGIIFFVNAYVLTTMVTLLYLPHMTEEFKERPALFGIPLLAMLAIANIPREVFNGRHGFAFLSSCGAMLALAATYGIGLYPDVIHSVPEAANSLTVYNAASSGKTLKIMLIIAALGVPLVLAYTASIYWVFRGKVKLDAHSY